VDDVAALPIETGFFDDDERGRAERVAALGDQRMLLLALQGEVGVALQRLDHGPLHWRSESARRYGTEREQLCEEVRHVLWAVDEAADRVAAALSALAGEG
jgi:hypothetical protein